MYESDDEEPQIEKIENKMDYSDDDKEGEDEEKAKWEKWRSFSFFLEKIK